MAKKNKKVSYSDVTGKEKRTIQVEDPASYDKRNASWAFSKCAKKSKWAISRENWKLWEKDILPVLCSYEGQTWAEIKVAQKDGKSSSKNHNVSVGNLSKEAQKELSNLFKKQYDEIFSLRFGNTKRIYGFLEKGVLNIVWYDAEHEIYPTEK